VAAAAIRAELAVVNIVGAMATAAIAVDFPHPGQGVSVAVVAGDFAVRTFQRE